MAANTPINISDKSQEALITYLRQCNNLTNNRWNIRDRMRQIDLTYQREKNWTEEQINAKIANKLGDAKKLQDLTIPVVYPAVEAAVTYQTSVFLTGSPMFPVVSAPQFADQALQMETVIDYEATIGGWKRELMMAFRDGFKYNLGAIECTWDATVTPVLETDISFSSREAKPKEVLFEGNKIKRWDLYNTFFDSRVSPFDIPTKGEFVGRVELMSRIQLKDFIARLPNKMIANVVKAFEAGIGYGPTGSVDSYFIPQINPDALVNKSQWGNFNWDTWAGIASAVDKGAAINYKDTYFLTTLYARILPSDFSIRVPQANTPQVWKFYIVNNQVVIYAERQTNAHNMIPVFFIQPNEDGLEYQSKSLADNMSPFQEISSSLMTSVLAARRRAISDRGLFDPSRVTEANINSPNPSAKIPVRPAAYGKPLSDAYFPIPFRDDQSPILMQQIGQIQQLAYQVSGQNPARQGQFVKGNKTRKEYEDVQNNANGRDQLCSILLEEQLFTPLKHVIKTNILQYQGGVSLFNRDKDTIIQIDPVSLRQSILDFKVADGLLPVDKLISSEDFEVALQVIGSSPAIGAGYNIAPMFSYLMKTKGLKLQAFEKSPEQIAYEQAMAQYQNLVMEAIKQKASPEQLAAIPQPLPQNFGWNPQQ